MKIGTLLFSIVAGGWLVLGTNSGWADEPVEIITPAQPSARVVLAAREAMRYLYLRTGHLLAVKATDQPDAGPGLIVISVKGSALLGACSLDPKTQGRIASLKPQQYVLKTITGSDGKKALLIVGGDDVGALYGTYRFIEHLGVRFYLHGDTIPDTPIALAPPDLDETGRPLFALRGIQPFHDFAEGPDWWNRDDYLAYVAQLPKLRMNFIGLHTYPNAEPNAEPEVWIGLPGDFAPDGTVKFSYPASWNNTERASWRSKAGPTGAFSCGASELFPADDYGPEVMDGLMPAPATSEQCNLLFNRVGEMYREVFAEARSLGVKTCIGTEGPLTIPNLVREHLRQQGKDPASLAVRKEVYEGIFARIAATDPVDYYWIWTPEGWTWKGNTPQQFASTVDDLRAAIGALNEVGHPFELATCGWVLGPKDDRGALDKILPKDMPMSSISRSVGNEPLDDAYGKITDRPTWAIPWLEHDSQLIAPEPLVGRMFYDAADARRLGCSGLFGLHWRTKALEMNVAALASGAWDQSYVPAGFGKTLPIEGRNKARSVGAPAFYDDFAKANFGPAVGGAAGQIMARMDGVNMPNPGKWEGPGGVVINPQPWNEDKSAYAFVDEFAALRPQVVGAGNLARFDYWLNMYRYTEALAHACCVRGQLDIGLQKACAEKDPEAKKRLAQEALGLRVSLAQLWDQMMNYLEATVSTPGELGTIANLELHTRASLLTADDAKLAAMLGTPLPGSVNPATTYSGPPRVIVPTVREQIAPDEQLHLRVILLGIKAPGRLYWRPLGRGAFTSLPLMHKGRSVYEVTLPAMPAGTTAFEYYIETGEGDSAVRYPVTAPVLNQTVVIGL